MTTSKKIINILDIIIIILILSAITFTYVLFFGNNFNHQTEKISYSQLENNYNFLKTNYDKDYFTAIDNYYTSDNWNGVIEVFNEFKHLNELIDREVDLFFLVRAGYAYYRLGRNAADLDQKEQSKKYYEEGEKIIDQHNIRQKRYFSLITKILILLTYTEDSGKLKNAVELCAEGLELVNQNNNEAEGRTENLLYLQALGYTLLGELSNKTLEDGIDTNRKSKVKAYFEIAKKTLNQKTSYKTKKYEVENLKNIIEGHLKKLK